MKEVVSGLVRDHVRATMLTAMRVGGNSTGKLLAPRMKVDPYPTYRWAREQGPVLTTTMGPTTSHYAVADAVLRHPKVDTAIGKRVEIVSGQNRLSKWLFSVPDRGDLIDPLGPESMIGLDGPDHVRLRRLTSGVFAPAAIEKLRPRLTEMTHEILDRALAGRTFDLMPTLAQQLPVWAICEILGIPDRDRELARRWGGHLAVDLDATAPAHEQREAVRVLQEVQRYLSDLLEAKRRNPGDDMLSRLIEAEEEGDRLSSRELLCLCLLLLLAGFETTVNLIGNGTAALLQNPDQLGRLREDPGLMGNAVEEMLRYDAPVQIIVRLPRVDLEVAGAHLAAGTPFSIYIGGVNRDPAVFEAPDAFDITRANARKHLSFAAGPHHCLGAALARLEAEIAFSALLERVDHLQLAGSPRRRRTYVMRGYQSIPLTSRP